MIAASSNTARVKKCPPVQFGARRIDMDGVPVTFRSPGISGHVPARVWLLEDRDYPRLGRLLDFWATTGANTVFALDNLPDAFCTQPVIGPLLRKALRMAQYLPGLLRKPFQFDEYADISLMRDYALTYQGKTLALLRLLKLDEKNRRFYEREFPGLNLQDIPGPVYELELLEAAPWSRDKQASVQFAETAEALVGEVIKNNLRGASFIFTPVNRQVERLFQYLLKGVGVTSSVYQNRLGSHPEEAADEGAYFSIAPTLHLITAQSVDAAASLYEGKMAQRKQYETQVLQAATQATGSVEEPLSLVDP